jgi:hypothetical protein
MFKVSIWCKKEWMPLPKELAWAIIANDPEDAIEKIKDKFDLDGVIIYNEKAEEVEYLVLNTF